MLNPVGDEKRMTRTGGEKERHLRPQLVQKLESESEVNHWLAFVPFYPTVSQT